MQKLIGIGIISSLVLFALQANPRDRPPPQRGSLPPNPRCVIKGNISVANGKKWYHLPGMEDYENTVIDLKRGERWFCSEKEAIAAGWKKAPR